MSTEPSTPPPAANLAGHTPNSGVALDKKGCAKVRAVEYPRDGHVAVAYVLDNWRPGSFDRTWAEEFADLGSPQRIGEMLLRTWDQHGNPRDELCLKMLRGEPIEPITLGWDSGEWGGRHWRGRVWAGHHRLWIFHLVGWPAIPADVVPPGHKRGWPANHCAPAEGRASA